MKINNDNQHNIIQTTASKLLSDSVIADISDFKKYDTFQRLCVLDASFH